MSTFIDLGRAGPGRPPPVLDDDRSAKLEALLSSGNYSSAACAAVGIPTRTYQEWMQKGGAGLEPYAAFAERIEVALAEGEARLVTLISRAAVEDWKAAASLLERRFPDRWQRSPVLNDLSRPRVARSASSARSENDNGAVVCRAVVSHISPPTGTTRCSEE